MNTNINCGCSKDIVYALHDINEDRKHILDIFYNNRGSSIRKHLKLLKMLEKVVNINDIKLLKTLISLDIKKFLTNDDFDYVLSKCEEHIGKMTYTHLEYCIDKSYTEAKKKIVADFVHQNRNYKLAANIMRDNGKDVLIFDYHSWNLIYYGYNPECDFGVDLHHHRRCLRCSFPKNTQSDGEDNDSCDDNDNDSCDDNDNDDEVDNNDNDNDDEVDNNEDDNDNDNDNDDEVDEDDDDQIQYPLSCNDDEVDYDGDDNDDEEVDNDDGDDNESVEFSFAPKFDFSSTPKFEFSNAPKFEFSFAPNCWV
jgi:hypothetical protein